MLNTVIMHAFKIFLLLQVCRAKGNYASNNFDLDAFFADKASEWSPLTDHRKLTDNTLV